jgi:RNA polymerase sigma-70 factor (ECF subfamily)
MLLLASALFLDEADKIQQRSANLPRNYGRANLRTRVASELDAVTQIATNLLKQACDDHLPRAPAPSYADDDVHTEPDDALRLAKRWAEQQSDRMDHARSAPRDAELNRLAELASGGDQKALEVLLGRIRPMVVQYCRARIGLGTLGTQSAEDIAQDTLLTVIGELKRWRPEKRVLAFVYGIASNKVVDAYRAAGRDRSVPTETVPDEPDRNRGPEQAALRGGVAAELRELLDQLPTQHREILVLRVALLMTSEEVAVATGTTPGAVRVTQHRALAKLRELVERHTA